MNSDFLGENEVKIASEVLAI